MTEDDKQQLRDVLLSLGEGLLAENPDDIRFWGGQALRKLDEWLGDETEYDGLNTPPPQGGSDA